MVQVFAVPAVPKDAMPKAHKTLLRQIWVGVVLGLLICFIIGGGMIGAFYGYGKDHFAGTEDIWEGVFGIIASVIITLMGAALLRVNKLQDKWRVKLAKALETKDSQILHGTAGERKGVLARYNERTKRWAEKYAMFLLPFITVLREGLEAVVFVGGVGLSTPATAFPLAVVCGLAAGIVVGYLIYRGGKFAPLQVFLIISTCFLYLVAAGLFSRGVWSFENNAWNKIVGGDASEVGSGPGSYNIHSSVWHVNLNGGGGWGIFNAILGWQNSATYGSVISYNVYWIAVILGFLAMRYNERYGKWPLLGKRRAPAEEVDSEAERTSQTSGESDERHEKDAADVSVIGKKDESPEGMLRTRELREESV